MFAVQSTLSEHKWSILVSAEAEWPELGRLRFLCRSNRRTTIAGIEFTPALLYLACDQSNAGEGNVYFKACVEFLNGFWGLSSRLEVRYGGAISHRRQSRPRGLILNRHFSRLMKRGGDLRRRRSGTDRDCLSHPYLASFSLIARAEVPFPCLGSATTAKP